MAAKSSTSIIPQQGLSEDVALAVAAISGDPKGFQDKLGQLKDAEDSANAKLAVAQGTIAEANKALADLAKQKDALASAQDALAADRAQLQADRAALSHQQQDWEAERTKQNNDLIARSTALTTAQNDCQAKLQDIVNREAAIGPREQAAAATQAKYEKMIADLSSHLRNISG